jgi:hypothetical protein
MMNEMTARDMILLGPTMTLEFTTPPTTTGDYALELKMTSDEGDVYTTTSRVKILSN